MGTNYYLRIRACEPCGRYDEIHVGKSGWLFRAYPHRLMNPKHPDWGYDPASPFGYPIESLADWRKAIIHGRLFDEYGREIDDPLAWLDGFRPPTDVAERWSDGDYLDSEGFQFSARPFS